MENVHTQERVGTVKWFDSRRGYGFIEQDGGMDVFVHADNLADSSSGFLVDGDKVKFQIGQGPKGMIAMEVRRVS